MPTFMQHVGKKKRENIYAERDLTTVIRHFASVK